MKYSELKRQLKKFGVTFEPGKGSHLKAFYGERRTVFPSHGSKEIPEPLRKKIIKDLGLEDKFL